MRRKKVGPDHEYLHWLDIVSGCWPCRQWPEVTSLAQQHDTENYEDEQGNECDVKRLEDATIAVGRCFVIRGERRSRDALEHLVRKHCLTASRACPSLAGKRGSGGACPAPPGGLIQFASS